MATLSLPNAEKNYSGFEGISQKTLRSLDDVDRMSPELRKCVHEFGYEVVSSIIQAGVTNPNKIRNIIHSCLLGPRNSYNRSGKGSSYSPLLRSIDALLVNSGSNLTAEGLLRFLSLNHMVIVPREPSPAMIDASIEAIRHMGRVSKRDKHRIRLKMAIDACVKKLWPEL